MFEEKDFKNTPIRICEIKKPYLNYIRKFDKRIPVKSGRKYIGLVILINGMQYVVPLTSKGVNDRVSNGKNKRSPIVTTNLKNVADILHNNMFPAPESEIIDIKDISNEFDSYLNYEYRFIRKNGEQ
jgi:protein AbiQ